MTNHRREAMMDFVGAKPAFSRRAPLNPSYASLSARAAKLPSQCPPT